MFFSVPVLYGVISKRIFSERPLAIMFPFLAFVTWLILRSIGSPALGQDNSLESIRGILILTPLALICAFVGARSSPYSARSIAILGFLALTHYCVVLFADGLSGEIRGFRSISVDADTHNYQSTSFYVGLVGVSMMSLVPRGKRGDVFYGMGGLLLTLILMGSIGARAAVVALLVSSVVIVMVTGVSKFVRRGLVFASLSVLIVALGFVLGILDIDLLKDNFVVIDRFAVLAEDDDSSQRLRLFSSALQMWFASPVNFLFGGGVGAFPQYIGETEAGWYPHNFILESLAEGGVVAGFFLLWIGREFVTKLRRLGARKASIEDVFFGTLAVYSLATYQFVGGLNTLWIPTFFVALFLFHQSRQKT